MLNLDMPIKKLLIRNQEIHFNKHYLRRRDEYDSATFPNMVQLNLIQSKYCEFDNCNIKSLRLQEDLQPNLKGNLESPKL